MPASRKASKPAPTASRVTRRGRASRSASTPNSRTRSSAPIRPASLMTSAVSSIVTKLPEPSSSLTTRVMCLSSMRRRNRCGISADELLTGEQPADVRVVEDVLGAGQAERRAGDDDGLVGGGLADVTARCGAGVGGQAALDASAKMWPSSCSDRRSVGAVPCAADADVPARGWRRRRGLGPGAVPARPRAAAGVPRCRCRAVPGRRAGCLRGRSEAGPARAGRGDGASAAVPRPAAYSPHSAWLNATMSPDLGWLVNSATASSCAADDHVLGEPVQRLLRARVRRTSRAPAS